MHPYEWNADKSTTTHPLSLGHALLPGAQSVLSTQEVTDPVSGIKRKVFGGVPSPTVTEC